MKTIEQFFNKKTTTSNPNTTKKTLEMRIKYKFVNPNKNLNSFEFVLKKQTESFSINKDESKKLLKKFLISLFIIILKHLFTRFIEYMFTNLLK